MKHDNITRMTKTTHIPEMKTVIPVHPQWRFANPAWYDKLWALNREEAANFHALAEFKDACDSIHDKRLAFDCMGERFNPVLNTYGVIFNYDECLYLRRHLALKICPKTQAEIPKHRCKSPLRLQYISLILDAQRALRDLDFPPLPNSRECLDDDRPVL